MRFVLSIALVSVAACSSDTPVTEPIQARAQVALNVQYSITKLGTLGGTSLGTSINSRGWVAGFSNLAAGAGRHATLWRDNGQPVDLRTLGGTNSNVQWPGLNSTGTIVGISQTSEIDPLNEDWSCSSFIPKTGQKCLGFVWEKGTMKPLPTFGGNNGFATGVNSSGQAVGWAETLIHDPTCNAPQVLQFRAAMWDTKNGTMQELPPLKGDSTTAATAINERGQVVGISGDCDVAVGRFSARHAVVWNQGTPTQLPNLGGISWHTPMALNDAGDIVGFSNPPGDPNGEFIVHAFLWTKKGGIKDLKLFAGHDFSQAFGINARQQVVGRSCGPNGCLAVLWFDGRMTNLNTIATLAPGDILLSARHINDAGVITGNIFEASSGRTLAYIATPTTK